jgi:nicotinate-nucleotide pyrophosphorylase (carboxylating)
MQTDHFPSELERSQIRQALVEDIGSGDVTSRLTIPGHLTGKGILRAKQTGILAGLPYAQCVFRLVDPDLQITMKSADGIRLAPGDEAAMVAGNMRSLLAAERLALNFVQWLSGIASLTARFVEAVAGAKALITDTRKTTPLWRAAEKYAVRMGGGVNHRMGLYDEILIKDNHIIDGRVGEAVKKARQNVSPKTPIIVEIRRIEEIEEAIEAGATRLLLDNMTPGQLRDCVLNVDNRAITESSGNVNLENVRAIALTGVDYISIGSLTHSATAADFNFKIEVNA